VPGHIDISTAEQTLLAAANVGQVLAVQLPELKRQLQERDAAGPHTTDGLLFQCKFEDTSDDEDVNVNQSTTTGTITSSTITTTNNPISTTGVANAIVSTRSIT
jgi:hypothetical protein